MKVKEVIEKLQKYNQNADVIIIDTEYVGHNIKFYGCGGGDGCTNEDCDDVSFIFSEIEDNIEKS